MNAKMLKSKKSILFSPIFENVDDFSDDETIYSDEMESDSELGAPHTGNKSKRLETCQSTGDQFRNRTKLASSSKPLIKRMPTRKPDPKVSNRNAIMARENRRKKKEHMEILQRTVEDTQNENRKLKKMLNVRNSTISKLTQESLYLRSILANKTQIMSLLRCIQGSGTPITSSVLSFVADNDYQHDSVPSSTRRISDSSSGCSPASASMSSSSYAEDDKENGTVWATQNDPFLSSFIEQNLFNSTDLDIGSHNDFTATTSPTTTESISSYERNVDDFQWENLLNEQATTFNSNDLNPLNIADLRDIDDNEILSTNSSNTVKNEHNYFNNPITQNKVADNKIDNAPGICLHVSSGRVSLEFCASCHINSQNAWCEEM